MAARRIQKRIEELFGLATDPGGGARRLAYSPEEARALLFAASANGVSHAPEEAMDGEDVENALTLLAALLPELESNYGGGNP